MSFPDPWIIFDISLVYQKMFEHASKIDQLNKIFSFGFSERLARKVVILVLGLDKRSGRPEQWVKMGEKYDLIRRFWPF